MTEDESAALYAELEVVQAAIDASDLWELDRRVARCLEALRCPPNDAELSVLSGGERRRVALARLVTKKITKKKKNGRRRSK
jgi:ATPase subunit of ABC transporter with duplicated ATPase domains